LHAAERVEADADRDRLLRQEVVVLGAVDRLVENAVERIIRIDVACIDRRFAGFVDGEQAAAPRRRAAFPRSTGSPCPRSPKRDIGARTKKRVASTRSWR